MTKRKQKQTGSKAPPATHNGNGKGKGPSPGQVAKNAVLTGNAKFMELVHKIIYEAPDIRPEKVGPLQEAIEHDTYDIDVRKLANILITKMFLEP
jgi:anti-sigma28 factor (negative regulator of flagellin synthesis)